MVRLSNMSLFSVACDNRNPVVRYFGIASRSVIAKSKAPALHQ